MIMKRMAVLILIGVLAGGLAWAGPIIIDGTDADNHGNVTSGQNSEGWAYMQRALEAIASQIGVGTAKVVVDLGSSSGPARFAINSAFSLSSLPSQGWILRHIDGSVAIDAWLANLTTANTGILYIPPSGYSAGDLDASELTTINGRSAELDAFVTAGGGLFAQAESEASGATPYGWLITLIPTLVSTDVAVTNGVNTALTLTPAGKAAFPTLSSASLTTGPWRNYFEGDLAGLKVLATADYSGTTRNVCIGGGAGTRFVIPPGGILPGTRPPLHPYCITRNAWFWFTHDQSDDEQCVTLRNAIDVNGGSLGLGFIKLPTAYRSPDAVLDSEDAVMEALGLFVWKSAQVTGEDGGTQNAQLPVSSVCRQRKKLSRALTTAVANNVLLGTGPSFCSYFNGATTTNFPADIIDSAGRALAGDDIVQMKLYKHLLAKFNRSGTTNDFFGDLYECSPTSDAVLMSRAADPTTQSNCGGLLNDTCATAQPVTLSILPFERSVDLRNYSGAFPPPSCGPILSTNVTLVRDIAWRISPPDGAPGRQFTVDTSGSNFDTVIAIYQGGTCSSAGAYDGGVEVACNDNNLPFVQSKVSFTTDGVSRYYIVISGNGGAFGQLKVKFTSP